MFCLCFQLYRPFLFVCAQIFGEFYAFNCILRNVSELLITRRMNERYNRKRFFSFIWMPSDGKAMRNNAISNHHWSRSFHSKTNASYCSSECAINNKKKLEIVLNSINNGHAYLGSLLWMASFFQVLYESFRENYK